MSTTLIITNDFPPRIGGIESFVADLVDLLDGDVVVYTSSTSGSAQWDRTLDFEVVRAGRVLLPTPRSTREAVHLLRRTGASRVLFGAAAPLGLMTPSLRRAGAKRVLALSHGHETWWATLPGARLALRRIAEDVDAISTISDYTAGRIAPALSARARSRMIRLAPPIDPAVFRPAEPAPERYAVAIGPRRDRQRVIAVARLVRQKGLDTLIRAWRLVLQLGSFPESPPELVLVGEGPQRAHLEGLVAALDLNSTVSMVGSMPRGRVISQLQQADIFALPVRTRLRGLNPEGLGLAAIEAAACALPVIIGDSGGAPETVVEGRTGFVVDSHDEHQLAQKMLLLLGDPLLARSLGAAGREFVTAKFGTEQARRTLGQALRL